MGDKKTSEPRNIWLAEACVSSLAELRAPEDSGSSRECTKESEEPCFSDWRFSSSKRFLLELRRLALRLRGPVPSIFNLLRSTLRLPNLVKSMLLRRASELARLISVLGRGLGIPPGDRNGDKVTLTLSSNKGVVVRIGGGGLGRGRTSLVACKDVRLEAIPFGL